MVLFYLQDYCLSSKLDSNPCRNFGSTRVIGMIIYHTHTGCWGTGRGVHLRTFLSFRKLICVIFCQTTLCVVYAYKLFPTFIHNYVDPRPEVKHWDFPFIFLVHSNFCFSMLMFSCLCLCCLLVRFALKCFFVRVDGGGNST